MRRDAARTSELGEDSRSFVRIRSRRRDSPRSQDAATAPLHDSYLASLCGHVSRNYSTIRRPMPLTPSPIPELREGCRHWTRRVNRGRGVRLSIHQPASNGISTNVQPKRLPKNSQVAFGRSVGMLIQQKSSVRTAPCDYVPAARRTRATAKPSIANLMTAAWPRSTSKTPKQLLTLSNSLH